MPGSQKQGAGRNIQEWQPGETGKAKEPSPQNTATDAQLKVSMDQQTDQISAQQHERETGQQTPACHAPDSANVTGKDCPASGANHRAADRTDNSANQRAEQTHASSAEQTHASAAEQTYASTADWQNEMSDAPANSARGRLPIYGALDLGTNNCRLLLARPTGRGFQIVDAFSRIIRLGEGLSENGRLSTSAMDRTLDALKICAAKMEYHQVNRARLIATEACRAAHNREEFLTRVKHKTGMDLEIIDQETEAKLAVSGCATLIDKNCDYALIFDIGGGSSELIWLDIQKIRSRDGYNFIEGDDAIVDWVSIPVGVVTMAEKFNGRDVSEMSYRSMIAHFKNQMQPFVSHIAANTDIPGARIHFLGTSGTVTTVAGVHLRLEVYDREKIDGLWMEAEEVPRISRDLMNMSFEKRAAIPSIGRERADLVLCGCAILEAMLETWAPEQLRVADRGLREGILAKLMAEDGHLDPSKRWVSQPKRQRTRHPRRARRSG